MDDYDDYEIISPTRRSFDSEVLLYASRRKFLSSAGKDTLHPPKEFQTKRQARREYLQHIDNGFDEIEEHPAGYPRIESNLMRKPLKKRRDSSMILKSIFATRSNSVLAVSDESVKIGVSVKATKLRKAAQFVMNKMSIEPEDVNPDDWKEELRAGVHYWVNRLTGEVSTDCPWTAPKPFVRQGTRQSFLLNSTKAGVRSMTMIPERMPSFGEGTGNNFLAYEHLLVPYNFFYIYCFYRRFGI